MYNRKTLGNASNWYTPVTILQQFSANYKGAHILGTQVKGLHKLVPVAKLKLSVSYKN